MADRSPSDAEQARRWMEQWRAAGIALERVKAPELAAVDIRVVATQLEGASRAALAQWPPMLQRALARITNSAHQRRVLQTRANGACLGRDGGPRNSAPTAFEGTYGETP